MGNESFLYYKVENAEAITTAGQMINKWTNKRLNELLRTITGDETGYYTIAGDTDSVVGNTLIDVNGKQQSIESLFDSIPESSYIKRDENDMVKIIDKGYSSISFNKNNMNIERKSIKYIMKHKVKKHMYRITVAGNSVIVTEDHSIVVKRNDQFISISPKELLRTDKIIVVK